MLECELERTSELSENHAFVIGLLSASTNIEALQAINRDPSGEV